MQLAELLNSLPQIVPIKLDEDPTITSIENDHRAVKKGSLFICIKGYTVDGHDFAQSAVENGAVAVISEKPLNLNVPVIVVPNSSRAMSLLANKFYNEPSKSLQMIGITGTNGKTTTCHLVEKLFANAQKKTGLIGTIHAKIANKKIESKNTTPESLTLQKLLNEMVENDVETTVMEVSSHALQLGRVHGIDFDIALYTNLSQDHLDFHETMEQYAFAKSLLFSQLGNSYNSEKQKFAIINEDDHYAEQFKSVTTAHLFTYGIDNEADIMAKEIRFSAKGTTFNLHTPVGSKEVTINLVGKFNVYNVLAAVSVAIVSRIPFESIVESLSTIQGVDGRFELVDGGQNYTVIVDYAHTPDGLENVLETIKQFAEKDIYVVVGCGGDRDKGKRPLMAKVACQYSKKAIFTSDNPRSENPLQILGDMEAGVKGQDYVSIVDRGEAINFAINSAQEGDVILIAGKGHETSQIIGTEVYKFDDRIAAQEAIKERAMKK